MAGVVSVEVENFGDVDLGVGELVYLIGPGGVFSVIFGGKCALRGEGAPPRAFVPGAFFDGFGRLPDFVFFMAEVEGDDGDAFADEGGELIKCDDVGIGAEG